MYTSRISPTIFPGAIVRQYFTQVQLEMRMTETNVCNFVVWTPNKTWILEIKGDKEFQDKPCTNLVRIG